VATYQKSGDGEEFAITTVRVPRCLYDAGKTRGINFSQTMERALESALYGGNDE